MSHPYRDGVETPDTRLARLRREYLQLIRMTTFGRPTIEVSQSVYEMSQRAREAYAQCLAEFLK